MIQFYAPEIATERALPADESAHCVRVLRMRQGDRISVVDGKGGRYECLIADPSPKRLGLEIESVIEEANPWPFRLTLAVAPTKNADRMEWLVEKAVEIGVDEIVFVDCQRSVRHKMSTARLRRIAVSAMNQSLKARLPEIRELTPFREFIEEEGRGEKYFGYCNSGMERCDFVHTATPGADMTIMIGPEGDFSESEVAEAMKAGYRPVTFGEQRLRTETAALYGVQAAHILASFQGTRSKQEL